MNALGTFDAIDFTGLFGGASLGPFPFAVTVNNQEYFEDELEEPNVRNIEGVSFYLAGSAGVGKYGISAGTYYFGGMTGMKDRPSSAQGFDLGLDAMTGTIWTVGDVYQMSNEIFPPGIGPKGRKQKEEW